MRAVSSSTNKTKITPIEITEREYVKHFSFLLLLSSSYKVLVEEWRINKN